MNSDTPGTSHDARQAMALARANGLVEPRDTEGAAPVALIKLGDDALGARDLGRYLFLIVKYLRICGYDVVLAGNEALLATLWTGRFARLLLDEKLVRLLAGGEKRIRPDILIHDELVDVGKYADAKRFVLIMGRRLTTNPSSYDVLFPYTLHPKYYANGAFAKVGDLRAQERNIRLFFSGNFNARYFDDAIFSKYGKLPRTEVLQRLFDGLTPAEIARIDADNADTLTIASFDHQFVFVDTSSGYRIAKREWLATLGRCDFFLACPGVDMPLSHNLVEAMSVGCIPLTQYGDYFDPPLRDGRECIAFSGPDDLVAVTRRVLCLDNDQVRRLRENATNYYERYLTPDAVNRRILQAPGSQIRVGLNFMPRPETNNVN